MKIAVILNYKKDETVKLAEELCAFLTARNCEIKKPENKPGYKVMECAGLDFSDCDLAVILGGDGTLLGACHYIDNKDLPLLTVNMGKVGFMTELEKTELFPYMEQVLNSDYSIEERRLLKAELWRDGSLIYEEKALNDFVLDNGNSYRTLSITTEINNQFVSTCKASGLIFSSPTGSTGYSLSAGGPIIVPQTKAVLLTHIAAHDLYDRPIVMPADSIIRIRFTGDSGCRIIADGQFAQSCQTGDEIIFTSSPTALKLVKIKAPHFFTALNDKMIKKN